MESLWSLVPSFWFSAVAEEVPAGLQEGQLSDHIPFFSADISLAEEIHSWGNH